MYRRQSLAFSVALAALVGSAVAARSAPAWVEAGPGPILDGQVQGLLGDSVAGAVNAIVPEPGNARLLFVGTVNGGIWGTSDATDASPKWFPFTDQLPALSIASLRRSPVNPKLIFGGTGSTSSYYGDGSPGFGVVRSTNRGLAWEVLAKSTFTGQVINQILPTSLDRGARVLAATRRFPRQADIDGAGPIDGAQTPARGLFFSTNATAADPDTVTFQRLSGVTGTGLPEGGVSSLVDDRSNPDRFYAGISADDGAGKLAGVYRTENGGATWAAVNGTGADALTGLDHSSRILLATHTDARVTAVYAAVIARGALAGVFRSIDRGTHWTALGVPEPAILPGGQGDTHGALVADPTDPNVAFIAGDRQVGPFPNANGCRGFFVSTFRLDASQPAAKRWQNVVCDGANGTAPHADSRAMAFDANGDLLQASDGGIYRLVRPNETSRHWVSALGNIRPTEFHSVAYDLVSKRIIGGTQDNGTPVQAAPGKNFRWSELTQGDGGVVAVDADQIAHRGTSLRYSSYYELQDFIRTTWNAANGLQHQQRVGLNVATGTCAGQKLTQCDKTVQFYNPFVLGTPDPSRMLLGTNRLYESLDRGDTLDDLTGDTGAAITGLVYGGRITGYFHPDVIYAGAGAAILHRVKRGGTIMTLKYPGSAVRGIAVSPLDYRQVAVLDDRNRVWFSTNEGASWTNLTGTLPTLTKQVRSILFFTYDGTLARSRLIAGGFGVFQLAQPGSGLPWITLSGLIRPGLPNALFLDLHYYYADDLLLAGSLGRGAWTLCGNFYDRSCPVAANRPVAAAAPTPYLLRLPPPPPPIAAPSR